MAICCARQELVPLKGGHKVLKTPVVPCNQKHGCVQVVPKIRDWLPNLSVYYGCVHNELVALYNRHLVQRLEAKTEAVEAVAKHWLQLFPRKRTRVYSEEEVVRNTSASRRKRVLDAFKAIAVEGLGRKDELIRSFIKLEKAEADGAEEKSPRLIQFRSFKFTAEFQRYLQPIEHHVFKLGQREIDGKLEVKASKPERLFAKGMNSWERGEWVAKQWSKFRNPRAQLWDVSRLDAHMGKLLREKIEFATYRRCNREVNRFLAAMAENVGWTANGIKYKSSYTMCSGEACTSLGDSVVVAAALKYAYRNVKHAILVDGDDSIVITENGAEYDDVFADLGLPMKLEEAHSIYEVEFCQCRPIRVGGAWRMVRNPYRVLNRATACTKNFTGEQAYRDWISSVGVGELACNDGVPILQQFGVALKSVGKMREHFLHEVMSRRPHEKFRGPQVITSETREDFACAFGIMPDQQRSWEQDLQQAVPYLGLRSD